MNNYKKLLFSFLLLAPFIAKAQVLEFKLIINAPKVNLRQYPSDTSKIIAQLLGGDELTRFDTIGVYEQYLSQKINEYDGHWVPVKYRDRRGYVYSRYVIGDFAIFEEGEEVDRIPMTKYAYGIYSTTMGDYLRPVSLMLTEEERINYMEDTITVQAIRVKNRKDTSIMLICTNKLMKEGIIGDFTNLVNQKTHDEHFEFIHLEAGDRQEIFCKFNRQERKVYSNGIVYELQAAGTFQMQGDNWVRGTSYDLFVTYYDSAKRTSVKQNILQFISDIETFYSVEIVYFGDLDNDNKPDVILQTCQEVGCTDFILLSTAAHEGELLRLYAVRFHPHNC